jgi:hypothetical protein
MSFVICSLLLPRIWRLFFLCILLSTTNKMQRYTIFLITVNALHVSGGFSTSGSSKQAWHIPDAVCTVMSSWGWVEKLPEKCRALTIIKNIV